MATKTSKIMRPSSKGRQRSPADLRAPLRGKHRPSNSCQGLSSSITAITNRINRLLSETQTPRFTNGAPKMTQKPSTPKAGGRVRSAQHKRNFSIAGRPLSTRANRPSHPQKTHLRKFSFQQEIPLSLVTKFSHKTRTGFIPGNPSKTNQDSYFECLNLGGQKDVFAFGVCDGHGHFGREVSTFVKQRLPIILSQDPYLLKQPKKALRNSILRVNSEVSTLTFDTNFSGTTLVMVLIMNKVLYCANVGDSRAVMAKCNTLSKWSTVALSRDHKPDDKDEAPRIIQNGGRVEAYQDQHGNPQGPARVWLLHQNLPGLAMSRSIGDQVAQSVGVTSEPQIFTFPLSSEDKLLLLGSDGIFEFLSSETVVKLAVPFWKEQDPQRMCETIANEAHSQWLKEEEVVDDITILAVFLEVS